MWGAGATPAAVQAYVEAYAAAATGAFVDAEAQALAKDRDDAAAAVICAFIGEVVAATRRDAASAALAEVAEVEAEREVFTKTLQEVERRILELVDEGGDLTFGALPLSYVKRYGQQLEYKALGFGRLGDFIESLRTVVMDAHGPHASRKIRRVPRILQRPAAAPAPAALSGDAGEFQSSAPAPAPAAAPRRLSGDAGEFRPASLAPAPMYAPPPIPPPPQGFVPVFAAPPPPLFVPIYPGERLAWPPPPGAPPPPIIIGSNSPLINPLMPGAPSPPPPGAVYAMHYAPNHQPED